MKTLILNGSPRRNGDTTALIGAFTEHLWGEYRIIDCYSANISPCMDCRSCRKQLDSRRFIQLIVSMICSET